MNTLRLSPLITWLLATVCQAYINTNYFQFPAKTEEIPTVHIGDTLNVTWLSDYSQAVMYFWCDSGAKMMEEIRDIGGDGVLSVVVNGSWTSPCHWQYCQQANEAIFVDSGHVRITNQRVTPAVTWKPSATGTACGIQPTTITNSQGQTITTTLAAATSTNTPASASASTTACAAPSPLSPGAGVGVGIGAGLAIAGVFAAIWVPLRRRCLRRVNGPPNGYMQDPSQIALQQQGYYGPKPVEAEGQHRVEMPNDPRVPLWTLSELPSTPHKRSPRLGP